MSGINKETGGISFEEFKTKKDHEKHVNGTVLTKRERFAMAAMQGMLANEKFHADMNASNADPKVDLAVVSVKLADALLQELENTEE